MDAGPPPDEELEGSLSDVGDQGEDGALREDGLEVRLLLRSMRGDHRQGGHLLVEAFTVSEDLRGLSRRRCASRAEARVPGPAVHAPLKRADFKAYFVRGVLGDVRRP